MHSTPASAAPLPPPPVSYSYDLRTRPNQRRGQRLVRDQTSDEASDSYDQTSDEGSISYDQTSEEGTRGEPPSLSCRRSGSVQLMARCSCLIWMSR